MDEPRRFHWLMAVAVAAHLVVGVFPYAGSGLVAPVYGVAVLWAAWAALAVMLWRLRARPTRAILVPPAALLAWVAVVGLGDALLGWTA